VLVVRFFFGREHLSQPTRLGLPFLNTNNQELNQTWNMSVPSSLILLMIFSLQCLLQMDLCSSIKPATLQMHSTCAAPAAKQILELLIEEVVSRVWSTLASSNLRPVKSLWGKDISSGPTHFGV
jgi:hypothetical protein